MGKAPADIWKENSESPGPVSLNSISPKDIWAYY